MSDNEIHNHEPENIDEDAAGHVAGGGPGAPDFVVDTPGVSEDDDAEGHFSGARHVDPGLPSGRSFGEDHPKAAEDSEAF